MHADTTSITRETRDTKAEDDSRGDVKPSATITIPFRCDIRPCLYVLRAGISGDLVVILQLNGPGGTSVQ